MAAALSANEPARLSSLRSMNLLDSPQNVYFDRIIEMVARTFVAPIATIALIDADRQWFKASVGLGKVTETSRDFAFCSHAILDPDTVLHVPDATLDERFSENPLVTGWPKIRLYAGAPIISGDKIPIGALCIIDTKPRTLTDENLRQLRAVAAMLSRSLTLYATVGEKSFTSLNRKASEIARPHEIVIES
jgi:GAF domain-containing protein